MANELHTAAAELGMTAAEFAEVRRAVQYGEISTLTRADIRRMDDNGSDTESE